MGCSQNKESFPLEKAQLLGDTKGQGLRELRSSPAGRSKAATVLDQVRQKGQGLDHLRRRRAHTNLAWRQRRARRQRRRQRRQMRQQILAKTRIQIWQSRREGERRPQVGSVKICISSGVGRG
jgi:hypothetical protein